MSDENMTIEAKIRRLSNTLTALEDLIGSKAYSSQNNSDLECSLIQEKEKATEIMEKQKLELEELREKNKLALSAVREAIKNIEEKV